MARFKILLFNTGYCLGLNGSKRDYFRYMYRYFYCPWKIQCAVLQNINELISDENVDLCCFIELQKYSNLFRNVNQILNLANEQYRHYHVHNKYAARGMLQGMPFFRRNSNGFLSKQSLPFSIHHLEHGRRRLVYEIELGNDIRLFMVHLAHFRHTRRRQFLWLKNFIKNKKRVIICGDFNLWRGHADLMELCDSANLRILNGENDTTFPSVRPKRCLDLFLCSRDIHVTGFKILDHVRISDHLPVVMEYAVG